MCVLPLSSLSQRCARLEASLEGKKREITELHGKVKALGEEMDALRHSLHETKQQKTQREQELSRVCSPPMCLCVFVSVCVIVCAFCVFSCLDVHFGYYCWS